MKHAKSSDARSRQALVHAQRGATNILLIPLVLVSVLMLGLGVAALSSYNQAQDYKTNVNKKIAAAVTSARAATSAQKDKDFAEKEKSPFNRYNGPTAYGGIRLLYPKTWSAYISEARGSGNLSVNGYFAPGHVPDINDDANVFALRMTIEQRSYDTVLRDYDSQVKGGKVTAKPYQSPNVPNLVGTRLDGEVVSKKQGAMIIMPLRDTTLKLWTESNDYTADFDNVILANFSFTP